MMKKTMCILLAVMLSCACLFGAMAETLPLTLTGTVVSGGSRVTATTESRSSLYRVSVDGSSFTLPEGSTIEICRAPYCLNILTRPDGDFASTLRHKLTWATP